MKTRARVIKTGVAVTAITTMMLPVTVSAAMMPGKMSAAVIPGTLSVAGMAGELSAAVIPGKLSVVGMTNESKSVNLSDNSKEEVIYVMTDANGTVSQMYAVNIFGAGDIVDYGTYSDVKMLTSTIPIVHSGDEIAFSSSEDKVYYQGNLTESKLPWKISIRYWLDGVEYSAKEIAGKSGALTIQFIVEQNIDCNEFFYENYALQAAFVLDTSQCSNIVSDGATVANIGSNKQLAYTILPGRGIDTRIHADVKDFTMDAVAINGVRLNLDMGEVTETLTDKVSELTDGIGQIDDGAQKLADGSNQLAAGSVSLEEATDSLAVGAISLDQGITQIQNGTAGIQTGLDQLVAKSDSLVSGSAEVKKALLTIQSSLNSVSVTTDRLSELTTASSAIKSGIDSLSKAAAKLEAGTGYAQYKKLMGENGLNIDQLKSGNDAAITELTTQINVLKKTLASIETVPGYETQVAEVSAQVEQLSSIVTLLSGNNAAIQGTESYLTQLAKAVSEVSAGIAELNTKYTEFDRSINVLVTSLSDMTVNLSNLSSGINELVTKYSALDLGIAEYTGGVKKISDSYAQLVSGTAELATGSKTLLNGANGISDGSKKLASGLLELSANAGQLADGTSELNDKTSALASDSQDKIEGTLSALSGSDAETISFISEKNKNVESVQFVIKTEAIEKEAVVSQDNGTQAENAAKQKNFWQKLLGLFESL